MGPSDACLAHAPKGLVPGRPGRATGLPCCQSPRAYVLRPLPRRAERSSRVGVSDRPRRPSSIERRLGARIQPFEACSGFTRVAARTLADPPKADLCPRGFDGSVALAVSRVATKVYRHLLGTGLSPAALTDLARHTLTHIGREGRGEYATEPAHMPHAHRAHAEWSPSRLITWAEQTGPTTAELVTTILATKPHPEQGYRACLGLMRLGKRHGAARLEAAAARALQLGAPTYRTVQNILASGADQLPLVDEADTAVALPGHSNIRGSAYYTGEEIPCSLTPPSTN
jgi:hypothetical protein